MVEESIESLSSRKFSLVKWSSNRDAVTVLSKLDEEKLCDIDLSIEHTEELPLAKTLDCVWDTQNDSFRIVTSLVPLQKYTCKLCLVN